MIRDDSVQFESAAEIRRFQEKRLREELKYIYDNSPYYKRVFDAEGIDISEIRTIEDLRKLPYTTKDDLQRHTDEFICKEGGNIIDYVTTSGTLGEPVTFALTESDLSRLAYNEALSFRTAGCSSSDVIQLMTTIDRRFMAGLAYFLGARELGSGIVRVGNGIPQLQWDTINRVKPSVCIVVPSFLLKLIEYAEANGIDHHASSLRKAICIGEPLRNPDMSLNTLGAKIAERWPELELHSTYASTEMQSSFTECVEQKGCHLPPDLIIVELLDAEGNPVSEGPGEVTITTLGVRGMPLVRLRTGDVCDHYDEPCACGRHTMRLGPVLGRKGQMIKFKGTTIYPPAMYDVLDDIHGVINYIVEVYTNSIGTDQVRIRIGSSDTSDEFAKEIKDIFRSKIRVAPDIVFEPSDYIAKIQQPPICRKTIKFVDLRENKNDKL